MPKTKLKINPLPKIFDLVQEDNRPFPPFTEYYCGTLEELAAHPDRNNKLNACTLPATKTKQVMDFGTLDDLCED